MSFFCRRPAMRALMPISIQDNTRDRVSPLIRNSGALAGNNFNDLMAEEVIVNKSNGISFYGMKGSVKINRDERASIWQVFQSGYSSNGHIFAVDCTAFAEIFDVVKLDMVGDR